MNDELLEGFAEWALGLPAGTVQLTVNADESVIITELAHTTNGVQGRVTLQSFEDIQAAADWFTNQGYGVQE